MLQSTAITGPQGASIVSVFIVGNSGVMIMQEKHLILAVHVTERLKHAVEIQNILSEYGDIVKTRLGLHDVDGGISSRHGVLILECIGDETRFSALAGKIGEVQGVEVKQVVFDNK